MLAGGGASVVVASALLFDLDGTLADTAAGVATSWRVAAQRAGIGFEAVAPFIHGIPADQALSRAVPGMAERDRLDLAESILSYQASAMAPAQWSPGAQELVRLVGDGRWGIVTSGDRRLASATMRKLGMTPPCVLVTADDVRSGKPDPEPFLKGARDLGLSDLRECVAVEDSPAGVASALAAGMRVLAVTSTHTAEELGAATWIVRTLVGVGGRREGSGVRLLLRPTL